jgi:EAL domain-containing protein (putative c-di-GMP-specific phosphodiesterase class I)
MGEWVLRTACRAATGWPGLGISVNVSPVQLRAGDFVGLVSAVLAETGLAPQRLELEITEGALMDDAPRARATLVALKRLGVSLAMDDFGTGYSSLGLLKTFPFDVLKIDRQFVSDIEAGEGGRGVIRAILALGASLGLSVTAEGVETSDQLRMLADHGCDEVQGFHLARPLAETRVSDLLAAEREAAAELPLAV